MKDTAILAKDDLISSAMIQLAGDYLNSEIDRLAKSGRMPAKNIKAARAMSAKAIEWLESQPADEIALYALREKAGEELVALYNKSRKAV